MGLVKNYLRYQQCGVFNVIGSTWAGLVLLDSTSGKNKQICAAVGACENVHLWNLRKGEQVCFLLYLLLTIAFVSVF